MEEEENAVEVVNTAILPSSMVNHIPGQGPLVVQLQLGQSCQFEVNNGARDNFCSDEM